MRCPKCDFIQNSSTCKILETRKTPRDKSIKVDEVIENIKNNCTTKFDESLDLSLQINNKQKKMRLILEQLLIYLAVVQKK